MRVKFLLAGLVIVVFVMCLSPIGRAAVDKDLFFYLSFDRVSGNTVEDESGKGNTGTLKGDAKIVKEGKYGAALSVSGGGYVDCGNGKVLTQLFPGITMEAWIYPKALAGVQSVVSKWANSIENDHYSLALVDNKVAAAVADGVTAEQGLAGNPVLATNKWTHIAHTWDSKDNTYRIYINGVFDATGKQTGKGINLKSTENLKVGAQVTGPAGPRYFNGLIDNAVIYGRVLKEDEIKKDIAGMADVQPSGKLSTTWAGIKTQY
jgi:hypothetical protein